MALASRSAVCQTDSDREIKRMARRVNRLTQAERQAAEAFRVLPPHQQSRAGRRGHAWVLEYCRIARHLDRAKQELRQACEREQSIPVGLPGRA